MQQSLNVQMLNVLEIFHYSQKFRHHLFVLVIENGVALLDLLTDIRTLYSAQINLLIITREEEFLRESLSHWGERGFPFEYQSTKLKKPYKEDHIKWFQATIASQKIGVLGITNMEDHLSADSLDEFAFGISEKLGAHKIFFLSKTKELEIDGKHFSYLTPPELLGLLDQANKINWDRERLNYLTQKSQTAAIDIALLEGKPGFLFQEIFTHKGSGTLLTRDYSNRVRQGRLTDIFDLLLLMKPYIQSKAILYLSEDDLAKEIESYYVYTVNHSIVAAAKLTDHNQAFELAKFCTLPRYQGKGRAKELALYLMDAATQTDKEYIFALSIHHKMWDFFLDLGFVECERETLPQSWKVNYDFIRKSKAFRFNLKP